MGLTLNQVLKRIQLIAESHQQIRSYIKGLRTDHFANKTALYPVCCVDYVNGGISLARHEMVVNFRMFVLDLVNVVGETKLNEDDVLSDTLSIITDLLAQLGHPNYEDWSIELSSVAEILIEYENDMNAGWAVEFTVRLQYNQNVCIVPSELTLDELQPVINDYKVYDEPYLATGLEGLTLTIPILNGKYILHVIREGEPLHKVGNLPDSAEYTTNMVDIGLGVAPNAGERFLILYRNP